MSSMISITAKIVRIFEVKKKIVTKMDCNCFVVFFVVFSICHTAVQCNVL